MEKTIKRTNQKQFELMVKLLEKNPELARGRAPFGSTKKDRMDLWEGIATELNNIGPPIRRGSEWNKVWLDYKLKLKKKIADKRRETVATDGVPYTQHSLTPLQLAVDELLSLQQSVNTSGATFQTTTAENLEENSLHVAGVEVKSEKEEDILNDSVTFRQTPITEVEEHENSHMKTVEKQTQTQESLVDVLQNMSAVTKEIAKYTRKMYKLKKEKLALFKMKEERKQQEIIEKKRRHKEKIEIKLKELELIEKMKHSK